MDGSEDNGRDYIAEVDYYERLLDYLDDMVPCLGELIAQFDEDEG